MKIIFIAGDGRSGSTILDSIIGNAKDTISVGECCRFWIRFYEKDTLCGCSEKIEQCKLWSEIDKSIKLHHKNYDPEEVLNKLKFILKYKNFNKIPEIVANDEWKEFCEIVKTFYREISKISGCNTIIDSTKFPNWANLLIHLNFCEVKIIHLERNLQSVANSWKKEIYLPEYYDKKILMPIKSNFLIVKTWIKVKFLSNKLKRKGDYYFLKYEALCDKPEKYLESLESFLNIKLSRNEGLVIPFNHSIGGNPIRKTGSNKIVLRNKENFKNINTIELTLFRFLNFLSVNIIK